MYNKPLTKLSSMNLIYVSVINPSLFWFQHLYISLTEIQIKREEEIAKNPFSKVMLTKFDVLENWILSNKDWFC